MPQWTPKRVLFGLLALAVLGMATSFAGELPPTVTEQTVYKAPPAISTLPATASWWPTARQSIIACTHEGDSPSAYFAFSLACAGDVNGDSFADVIVGAYGKDNGAPLMGAAYLFLGSEDGLGTQYAWRILGDQSGARFGYSVAGAGDTNGDGYADVVVGAPYYSNGQSMEGAIYLYRGNAGGLETSPTLMVESNQAQAYLGISVAGVGNVNGDGYDDFIAGAYRYSVDDQGAVWGYYGEAGTISATPDWEVLSGQANAYFGSAVAAAGDVNCDGFADVLVGAYNYAGTEIAEGRAYLYYGSAGGLATTPSWTAESNVGNAWFGGSVAGLGDVNGDGYADIAIGAYRYSDQGESEGAVFVYHGSDIGLASQADWQLHGVHEDQRLGSVAGVGDINGDGYADLLLGAYGYEDGAGGHGGVWVFGGSSSGLQSEPIHSLVGDQAASFFGGSLAAGGDINGDGYGDLLLGAYKYDNGETDEGAAFLILGGPDNLSTQANWQTKGGQSEALAGYTTANAGDVNGDGFSDLVVGVPYYDLAGDNRGRVLIHHGSATGLSATPDWLVDGLEANAQFGYSVAGAGDVNSDGYDDIIIGAPGWRTGADPEGRAFLYLGSPAGLQAAAGWTASSSQAHGAFGCCVAAAGDVNGDGYADVIVGAYAFSDGENEEGAAFVYLGSSAGLAEESSWMAQSNQARAHFGTAVAGIGDINRDGFADVAVGADDYDKNYDDEGAAFVYYGSRLGLDMEPNWIAVGGAPNAGYGRAIAGAGDVNQDGFSDLLVGADSYSQVASNAGAVFLYLGSQSGLAFHTKWESQQANVHLGEAVAGAGDVNGDGYGDVIIGSPQWQLDSGSGGAAFIAYGSPTGSVFTVDNKLAASEINSQFGSSVSGGGDFNGDGFADAVVGAPHYDGAISDQGLVSVYYGGGDLGRSVHMRQQRIGDTNQISQGGVSDAQAFKVAAIARYPGGRGQLRFQLEYAPFSTNFARLPNPARMAVSPTWIQLATTSADVSLEISNLAEYTAYHWRARFEYPRINPLGMRYSRWFTLPGRTATELHLRTQDQTPPTNPASLVEANDAASGSWQNQHSNVSFTWSGQSDDMGSGIKNFDIYWGDDPTGATPTLTTSNPAFAPSAVDSPSVHYLRLRVRDHQDNTSAWQTMFILMYDSTPPELPAAVSEASATASDTWQRDVRTPTFTWPEASDGMGSGIQHYEIAWSVNPNSETAVAVSDATQYSALAVSSPSANYLRMRVVDMVGNTSAWSTLFVFKYDHSPPINPIYAVEASGAQDNVWQNFVSEPLFNWFGANDGYGSGLASYDVYWGPDMIGQSIMQTSITSAYTSTEVASPLVYYLRVRSRDQLGNTAPWKTLFTFRYDKTPPTPPSACLEQAGVASGAWQNRVSQPSFSWAASNDHQSSGMKGYDIYWGEQQNGTQVTATTVGPAYMPAALSGAHVFYLRARSRDQLDNVSNWVDMFTFQYDGQSPSPPTMASESGGSTSGVWQNTITSPVFNWSGDSDGSGSGVQGYDVYWGDTADAQDVVDQVQTSRYAPTIVNSPSINYLRVRVRDRVGNLSTWQTLFIQYTDTTPPTNPTRVWAQEPIESDVWQSHFNQPVFEWSTASDGAGSGLKNYDIYWGNVADGSNVTALLPAGETRYSASPATSLDIHYLRMRTRDQVGNVSAWQTMFIFKYDDSVPRNPNAIVEANGVVDASWQNSISSPSFSWSGAEPSTPDISIQDYDVYWGPSPDGTNVITTTTQPAYDPGPAASPSVTYLRLRTRDSLGNVSAWKTMFTFKYDATAPVNPSYATEMDGVLDDIWQNDEPSGDFTWLAASDGAGCGVLNYDIYFGPDPAGVSVQSTTDGVQYHTSVVDSPQINYLRLRTRDLVGNTAPWATLFTFKYDKTPPLNPNIAQDTGGVQNTIWQNATRNPLFTWSGADDPNGVGVLNYDVFWGAIADGTQIIFTTEGTVYDPPLVSSPSISYLRLRTRDKLGNVSDWVTLFDYRYDHTAPWNPTLATETGGALNAVPQSEVPDPAFTWTGADDGSGCGLKEYDVYWGTDSQGTDILTTTTSPAYDPPAVPLSGTYYLRVRTRDNLSNVSGWKTLFAFIYDHQKPGNPTTLSESGGALSGQWQNTVSTPTFTWSGAVAYQGTSITSYDIYWGENEFGTTAHYNVADSPFTPDAVSGTVVRYLRLRTRDNQDGVAEWVTLFKFMYDGDAPQNPTAVREASGTASGIWQKAVGSPTFTWSGQSDGAGSGISEYDVYWGSDPAATIVFATAAMAQFAAPSVTSPTTTYLRVRTRDMVGNVSAWVTLYTLKYDASAPASPTLALEEGGARDNIWQKDIDAPLFTWSGANDGNGSGLLDYDVFWGTISDGTVVVAKVQNPSFRGRPVNSPSVWYLRVRTRDQALNTTSWKTLFTYRSDQTAPTNPTSATETGGALNNIKQGLVNDPAFSWSGASDDTGSGVKDYDIYWGEDANGQIVVHNSAFASYDPTAVSLSSTNYLRVRTRDHVGNVSAWSTLFIFRYDHMAPTNPSSATEISGAENGKWQSQTTSPQFTWTGAQGGVGAVVSQYDVYFGPNRYGTTAMVTVNDASFTAPPVSSPSINYLRVRTYDNFGGIADWATLFEFRYDGQSPTTPGNVSEASATASGQWQNLVNAPSFFWTPAADGTGAGVKEYDVYFGPKPKGDNITATVSQPNWQAAVASSPSVNYLRVRSRDNVGNQSDWKDMYILRYDATAPANPVSATNTAGVADSSWQNLVPGAVFTWSGAEDAAGSGVKNYDVYWGRDPLGAAVVHTTLLPTYDAPSVPSPAIYSLRIRTRDNAENVSNWTTLFTYNYDASPPTGPVSIVEASGAINAFPEGGVYQPHFSWTGADDGQGIGVGGYDIYWGLDKDGEQIVDTTTTAAFVPAPVTATAVWYLRLRTWDLLDNANEWQTAFVFNYVHGKPGAPRGATEENGATNGVWQSHVAAPSFIWYGARSGFGATINGYDVYWGSDPRGHDVTDTVSDAHYAPTPLTGDGIYYLRVRTKDDQGGVGDWANLFTLKYDGTPPVNPNMIAELNGLSDGDWQNLVSAPNFSWSGASDGDGSGIYEYEVYFGDHQLGTDVIATTTDTNYLTNAITTSPDVYYFRIRTLDNAGNISNWSSLFSTKYDISPPENVPIATEAGGAISDTWQKAVKTPVFVWQNTSDGSGSGVKNFDIYWGKDPAGALPVSTSIGPSYAPRSLQGSVIHYLRIRTRDAVGNVSDWNTVFNFNFDEQPPTLPTSVVETHGVPTRVMQSEVSQPSFSWSGASDQNGVGIKNYDAYWGDSPTGTDGSVTTVSPIYDASQVLDTTPHYLRLRTRDVLNNVSAWQTVYEFLYNAGIPHNPTQCVEQGGAQDTIWQRTVTKPVFTWSGASAGAGATIDSYDVYWGASSFGNLVVAKTNDPGFSPGEVDDTGIYYLRVRTRDSFGALAEWKTMFTFQYDGTPPRSPLVATETNGAYNNTWQATVNSPRFIWDTARDGIGSGTKEYDIYWGTDPAGAQPVDTTNAAVFSPVMQISPAVSYLRVRSRDAVGNVSDWGTLFTYKYDQTPPQNPSSATEAAGAPDNTWQSTVSSPVFNWAVASDGIGVGVKEYDVYWGTDPMGSLAVLTTAAPSFNAPGSSSPAIYNLRVRTRDKVGNTAGWATLFSYQYDKTPPTGPTSIVEANGVRDNDRQGVVNAPSFSWVGASDGAGVGVLNYDVYWGDSNIGAQVVVTTASATYTPAPISQTGLSYLRLRTRDKLGNVSDWQTMFRFNFDHLAPSNPDQAQESGGAQDGQWQAAVSQPKFTWSGAQATAGATIDSYDVYWGTDEYGHSVTTKVTSAGFNAPAASNGLTINYLRVRTRDSAGGLSDWVSLFEFRFDGQVPTLPGAASEINGIGSGQWQRQVAAPQFSWGPAADGSGAGVTGYDIYFGADPSGTAILASTSATSYQAALVSDPSINYLRVRTQDAVGNVSAWKNMFTLRYDGSAPANPTSASNTAGIADDTWQNTVAGAVFTWDDADDSDGSGVQNYDIYWGFDPLGTGVIHTTKAPTYAAPNAPSPAVYSLRVRSRDKAGNVSDWNTLFTHKYDITPPAGPTSIVEASGTQNAFPEGGVYQPHFSWTGADDSDGIGVGNYDIYWGQDENGEQVINTTATAAYVPAPVTATAIWYLRLRTHDLLDNANDWQTAFVFNYVHGKPGAPRAATEENGAISSVWQSQIASPSFIWSGARSGFGAQVNAYDVYWGTDPYGSTAISQVNNALFAPVALTQTGVYYLRLRTRDNQGGVGDWATLFTFKYDNALPTNPLSATELSGLSNNTWQNQVSAPNFRWLGAHDSTGSGVQKYDIYFGDQKLGAVVVASTTGTAYQTNAIPSSPAIYYLRIRTWDIAGNVSGWSSLFTVKYDVIAPSNVRSTTETGGAPDNVWQKTSSTPVFVWQDTDDGSGSGVKAYEVFWGVDANGNLPVYSTALPTFSPLSLESSGAYTLRIRTRDVAGNVSDWNTVFTFNYDEQPPSLPTSIIEQHGAETRVRQSETAQPSFSWSGASDKGGSGIKDYDVYWGNSPTGTDGTITTVSPIYNASQVVDKTPHYLRLRSRDVLENVSPWQTVFEFLYDAGIPHNPTQCVEQGGAKDGVWQRDITNPAFTWSGAAAGIGAQVDSYDVYWGISSYGSLAVANTQDSDFSPGEISDTGIYYLRVRTKDNQGAIAKWKTMFTFKYDGDPPTGPTTASEASDIASTTWQNLVDAPSFTWESSRDGIGSGTLEYDVYWGSDVAGTQPVAVTDVAAFLAGVQSSPSVSYLRARSRDQVGNNSVWHTLFTYKYDNSPPENPASAIETSGAASGIWQSTVASPLFSWTPSSDDDGAGVKEYDVYWGNDPMGAIPVLTTQAAAYHAPPSPSPMISYLRLRTRDMVGNATGWVTLFTYQYDHTPPSGPTNISETNGVRDNDRQGVVNAPSFIWSGASDGVGVGVLNYDVYWGDSNTGSESVATVTDATYIPTPVQQTGVSYLRLRTRDKLGNLSAWQTAFRFNFDHLAPSNPSQAQESGGAQSEQWQAAVNQPVFTWSGAQTTAGATIDSYDVYWGTDEYGHDVTTKVTTAGFNAPAVSGVAINYLRVRTRDSAGGLSDWVTLFKFMYDGQPPTAASVASESTGTVNGAWQNQVQNPQFSWRGADDGGGCGIGVYDIYFGSDPNGTTIAASTGLPTYSPPQVADPSIHYLRVRTQDLCGNTSAWNTLFVFQYDASPPTQPAIAEETTGAGDGVWQSSITNPVFVWPEVSDGEGCGQKSYSVYWGSDPDGRAAITETKISSYRPGPLSRPGDYYLRVRSVDNIGNAGDWSTIFTFLFDDQPPSNPDTIIEASGVVDGIDQSLIVSPVFTWSGADDSTGSGIDRYDIYWGASSTGSTVVASTSTNGYSPPSATGRINMFLRVRTWDLAGNVSDWDTLFNFMYNPGIPRNPTSVVESNGAKDNVWQVGVKSPSFTWSGASAGAGATVSSYDVYWGQDPFGVGSGDTITTPAFTPPALTQSSVFYLRVRTRDSLSQVSPWVTLFTFKYDPDAPGNPSHIVEQMGTATNVWQDRIDAPRFTWSGATDGNGSGVAEYDVYWGDDANGTSIVSTTSGTAYAASVVPASQVVYYLRLRTRDAAGNNADWATYYTFKYDTVPPENPTLATEASGVKSGVWQNAVAAPSLIWSGADDGTGSGVRAYDVYWGSDQAARQALLRTTSTSYQPHAIGSPSVRYLRLRTLDIAGNSAGWSTLFAFFYDNTPPTAPTSVFEASGSVSNVLQGKVNQPAFTWSGATDSPGAGVQDYDIYWGAQTDGQTVSATSIAPAFAASTPVAKGTYYLRVRVRDSVGNVSNWSTLFVFKFDPGAPTNPTSITEKGGALDGVWQNTIAAPEFSWTGAAAGIGSQINKYDVYWGSDISGTDVTASPTTATWKAPASTGVTVMYLRIRTHDQQGGLADWHTMFTFKYDPEAPTAPTTAEEQSLLLSATWQHDVKTPRFSWSGAGDGTGSGIGGYQVYFGPDAAADIAIASVTSATYLAGQPGSPSISYLRVRTVDGVGNQSDWATLYQFNFDNSPPSVPLSATETNSTGSDVWQNLVAAPTFVWDAVSDASGIGVAGYDVYWGDNPNGSNIVSSPGTPSYAAAQVSGVRNSYLRVRSRDLLGNASAFKTLFNFKYDNQAPILNQMATETGGAPDSVRQSAVIDPAFTWPAASDGSGSGVLNYDVYWGTDTGGTTVSATVTQPLYDPPSMTESGIMYLRVRARDLTGNLSAWLLLFTFDFDGGVPNNPTSIVETHGLQSDQWQNQVNAPAFNWEGAKGSTGATVTSYDIYWGTHEGGNTVRDTTTESRYTPAPMVGNVATYYLRLRTHDSLNGVAPWQTLFIYHYDASAPTNPSSVVEDLSTPNKTWQNRVNRPRFTWSAASDDLHGSGIDSYDVYWGPPTSDYDLTAVVNNLVFSPANAIPSPAKYQLRLRSRDRAGNYANWSPLLYTLQYDSTAPQNPASATETTGVQHDTWQNQVGTPSLVWSEASDGDGSGVKEYDVYWGADSNGQSVLQTVKTPSYTSGQVASPGSRYLRVRTRDNVGNTTHWATLFAFRYDNTPPTNPTGVAETNGVYNDIEQGAINDPAFTWWGADDGVGSGVAGYDVYWGPLEAGSTISATPEEPTFDPGPVASPNTSYLRVRTHDSAGNVSDWATIFVFKYDENTPSLPANVQELNGATSDSWNNITTTPTFSWSGAAGGGGSFIDSYDVYWGPDSQGSSVVYHTTQEEYGSTSTPTKVWKAFSVSEASGVEQFYLRMRVHDERGTASEWGTIFSFDYDGNPPTSQVTTPPVEVQAGPTFTIRWSGSDGIGESGLAGVQVWYDKDDGGWLQYGDVNASTAILFDSAWTGGIGDYKFYIRAVDVAGNLQAETWQVYETTIDQVLPAEEEAILLRLFAAWHSVAGDNNYDAELDTGPDGVINWLDLFDWQAAWLNSQ
jgi:FG-GAP repeat